MKIVKKGSVAIMIGLYVLTIPFFNALNVTSYDNSQILGHFGESTTSFTYSSYIPVFAMLAFVPLGLKISKQIPLRTLVLTACFLSLIFNTASLYSHTIYWFTFWRALVAMVSITGIFATLIPIILKYNPTFNMAIMYGIVQFIQKGSQHLYQYIGVKFSNLYDWTFSIYFLNINFIICIALAWLFYKKDVSPMKSNFNFDWLGWILYIGFLIPILFLCTEGQTRNWLTDTKIYTAVGVILILISIYFIHNTFTKTPMIDTAVFRYKNVVLGSFLFFYIGIMNGTGGILTGFMTNILGFDSLYASKTHLAILLGLIIAIPLTTYLLFKRIYLATIWIIGFACFGMYHSIMYFRFYPGIDTSDFFAPLVFKGMAIGILYPISALYISEGIPKNLGDSRMMSGIIARPIFASLLGGALLGTLISNTTMLHRTGLTQQFNVSNFQAQAQLSESKKIFKYLGMSEKEAQKTAEKKLYSETSATATMLAYKDIYLIMSAVCFFPIVIILLFKLARRPLGRVEVEPIPL